jgi:hypothetical protein
MKIGDQAHGKFALCHGFVKHVYGVVTWVGTHDDDDGLVIVSIKRIHVEHPEAPNDGRDLPVPKGACECFLPEDMK